MELFHNLVFRDICQFDTCQVLVRYFSVVFRSPLLSADNWEPPVKESLGPCRPEMPEKSRNCLQKVSPERPL